MACEAGDLVCEAIEFAQFAIPYIQGQASSSFEQIKPYSWWAFEFAKWLLASLVFCFGIWKWYQSRDSVLFERMEKLLDDGDRRLNSARNALIAQITIPGPTEQQPIPIFAVRPLKAVLSKHRWNSVIRARSFFTTADANLFHARRELRQRIRVGERQQADLWKQQQTALLLRGAISTARAERTKDPQEARKRHRYAMLCYREAAAIRGCEPSWRVHELLGREYLALGDLVSANAAFIDMEAIAREIPEKSMEPRRQAIAQAQWLQAQIAVLQSDGPSGVANNLLLAATGELGEITALSGRDLYVAGLMHELHANVRARLRFMIAAEASRQNACQAFSTLVGELETRQSTMTRQLATWWRRLFHEDREFELRQRCQEGLQRLDALGSQLGQSNNAGGALPNPAQTPATNLTPAPAT